MRRVLGIIALGVMLGAAALAPAWAWPGVALRWDRCHAEAGAPSLRAFACDTNEGTERLVGSFLLGSDLPEAIGAEIIVDVWAGDRFGAHQSPAYPLPEWWKFKNPGACRQAALEPSFTETAESSICQDWAAGHAAGGIAAYRIDLAGPGTARLLMADAIRDPFYAQQLFADTEYFLFALAIRHDRTVGDGACSGCDLPMLLILSSIKIVSAIPASDRPLAGPINGTDSDFVRWQPAVVPAQPSTWAAVKARFR